MHLHLLCFLLLHLHYNRRDVIVLVSFRLYTSTYPIYLLCCEFGFVWYGSVADLGDLNFLYNSENVIYFLNHKINFTVTPAPK